MAGLNGQRRSPWVAIIAALLILCAGLVIAVVVSLAWVVTP
jgi:cytochrome c oxidase subunit IV